jgi:hypothetical protein
MGVPTRIPESPGWSLGARLSMAKRFDRNQIHSTRKPVVSILRSEELGGGRQ